ncbi:MAG: RIFT barrel domain-containing protein [Planctomycetota bacterium]
MIMAAVSLAVVTPLILAALSQGVPAPLLVENSGEEEAVRAPVSAGVPFGKGALRDATALSLAAADGKAAPLQAQCLSKWPDGSVRWVLLDFAVDVPAGGQAQYGLGVSGENPLPANPVEVSEAAFSKAPTARPRRE